MRSDLSKDTVIEDLDIITEWISMLIEKGEIDPIFDHRSMIEKFLSREIKNGQEFLNLSFELSFNRETVSTDFNDYFLLKYDQDISDVRAGSEWDIEYHVSKTSDGYYGEPLTETLDDYGYVCGKGEIDDVIESSDFRVKMFEVKTSSGLVE